MRVVFIQYGDYREAYERLAAGGEETYYAQKHTVDYVTDLAGRAEMVAVVYVGGETYPEMTLGNGVRVVGVGPVSDAGKLSRALEALAPTHVVLRAPEKAIIKQALRSGWALLPLLADSFEQPGLRHWWRYRRLAGLLNDRRISMVANHGISACRSLKRIGVTEDKVFPYDLLPTTRPEHFPAKTGLSDPTTIRLIYTGLMRESKGVGDLLGAAACLLAAGYGVQVTMIGEGALETYQGLIDQLGLSEHIRVLGRLPHARVLQEMHEHDVVIVPSRHEYPEGFPCTIIDGLCSRSPVIVSDHPMFAENIIDGRDGLVCKAHDPESLAETVLRLVRDPELYAQLSAHAPDTWRGLHVSGEWGEVITHFLEGSADDKAWRVEHHMDAVQARRAEATP